MGHNLKNLEKMCVNYFDKQFFKFLIRYLEWTKPDFNDYAMQIIYNCKPFLEQNLGRVGIQEWS